MTNEYGVVLADPPWTYTGQQDKWGAAAKFYKTMSNEELLSFTMASDILAKDGVLFCWATSPRLDFTIDCVRSWGLHYRGIAFVWVKTKKTGEPIGAMGVRPSIVKPTAEFVIAATHTNKGRPRKLYDESIRQVILAPKTKHSEKPAAVQEAIEKMYPHTNKIELFARTKRDGWDAWGDEVDDD